MHNQKYLNCFLCDAVCSHTERHPRQISVLPLWKDRSAVPANSSGWSLKRNTSFETSEVCKVSWGVPAGSSCNIEDAYPSDAVVHWSELSRPVSQPLLIFLLSWLCPDCCSSSTWPYSSRAFTCTDDALQVRTLHCPNKNNNNFSLVWYHTSDHLKTALLKPPKHFCDLPR